MPDWIKHPDNKFLRLIIGVLLILGGLLGFLPILGFWMIPMGLAVLAIDYPAAARANQWFLAKLRRGAAWWRLQKRRLRN